MESQLWESIFYIMRGLVPWSFKKYFWRIKLWDKLYHKYIKYIKTYIYIHLYISKIKLVKFLIGGLEKSKSKKHNFMDESASFNVT